jgi:chlorophyll(ide) b reductase
MATAAHLSVHARSPDPPSRLRCRAFKQGPDPNAPRSRRRKGPLYTLKAAIQGLAGSRAAAAEVYGGEYQRAVEKAEEVFFSVRPGPALSRPRTRPDKFGVFFSFLFPVVVPTIR